MSDWDEPRRKTIEWYDPRVTAAGAVDRSGREFLHELLEGRLPAPPIMSLIGGTLVSVGDGEVHLRCAPDESTYNPIGMVHGGLLCTLLDSAAGLAVHSRLPVGASYASIEIKVSFLKALQGDGRVIDAYGRVQRVGRRVAFAEAEARNGGGELVGHATSSMAITMPSGD
ncbi:MAG TPA: PaaI family thioesterase [Solirubrobacteraceae bacterium]|jgi:uncharacterized protein (TIGR00369 family)|nr:PaaI family thioesterase [Solirubrobacteraceae bacterium]